MRHAIRCAVLFVFVVTGSAFAQSRQSGEPARSRQQPNVIEWFEKPSPYEKVIEKCCGEKKAAPADSNPATKDTPRTANVGTKGEERSAGDEPNRRIWFEQAVARATTGYDAKRSKTLISSYSLAVYGPSSVESVVMDVVKKCSEEGGIVAIGAFQQTPSPEVGARIGAAWVAFKAYMQSCLSTKEAARKIQSQFDLGYVRRAEWVEGLQLYFDAKNPSAIQYEKLHSLVRKALPQPINQLISFYIQTQHIPKVDTRLDVPDGAKVFLRTLPNPEDYQRFIDDASTLAQKAGKRLISQATDEAKKQGDRAYKQSLKLPLVPLQLTGDVAKSVIDAAPNMMESMTKNPQSAAGAALCPTCAVASEVGKKVENEVKKYLPKL